MNVKPDLKNYNITLAPIFSAVVAAVVLATVVAILYWFL
jgi:hypothetical protein